MSMDREFPFLVNLKCLKSELFELFKIFWLVKLMIT